MAGRRYGRRRDRPQTYNSGTVITSDQSNFTRRLFNELSELPNTTPPHHNRFAALFPGPPRRAGARRELVDFMVEGKINKGRQRCLILVSKHDARSYIYVHMKTEQIRVQNIGGSQPK